MPKTNKEIDAAYKAKKQAHGLIYRGYWVHHTITEKVAKYIAERNKEALKVDGE